MYKVKRFSRLENQRAFALREHVKQDWKKNLDLNIPGSSSHTIGNRGDGRLGNYSEYNLVWLNPDTGEVIDKFVSIKPYGNEFKSDINLLDNKDTKHLKIALNDLRLGYVFDDNDKRILKDKYDTATHCLNSNSDVIKLSGGKFLAYSKSLSNANRLTYKVYKPEKDLSGDWYCNVEISRCYGHNIDGVTYDMKNASKTKNSIGSLFGDLLGHNRDVTEFEKLFSEGYLGVTEK